MQLLYSLDMARLEHSILCNGIGARFNLSGKYLGNDARILSNSLPADAVSILQQGTLCEIAILTNDTFRKQQMDLSKIQQCVQNLPLQPKAVFTIKRQVVTTRCTQTLYIYNYNRLQLYINQLMT